MTATASTIQRYAAEHDDGFVILHHVPVFKEHIGRDGTRYGRELLQCICDNLNARIEDTGDYCVLTLGHTPTEEEAAQGHPEPEQVGFAGPFTLGLYGNNKPKWCIFAIDWRVRADRADEASRRPRRSPELIETDNPRKRWFDVIALLGAETPKLDLGLVRYSHRADGIPVARYEAGSVASTPGGSNTFIPTDATNRKKSPKVERLQAKEVTVDPADSNAVAAPPDADDGGMKLSEAALQQIMQAFESVIDSKVDAKLAPIMKAIEGMNPASDEATAAGAAPVDATAPAAAPAPDANAAPAPASDLPPDETDNYAALCKYAAEGEDKAKEYFDSLDDDGRDGVKERYEAEEDAGKKKSLDSIFKPQDKNLDGMEMVQRYRRERDGAVQRYQQLQIDLRTAQDKLKAAEDELEGIAREKVRVERYGILKDLNQQGFMLNVDEEIEDVADLDAEAWDKHQKRIVQRYQRFTGRPLPRMAPEAIGKDQAEANAKRATAARDYALAHPGMSFSEALQHVGSNGAAK